MVEIWTLKVLFGRIQKKVQNMLPKNGGKETCYFKAETWLHCVLQLIWKARLQAKGLEYLAGDIRKLRVEGIACFLSSIYKKMR